MAPLFTTKKQYKTSRISPNAEIRSKYTGVLEKKWIRYFYRSIGCPKAPPTKIYEDNQETMENVLADIIAPQTRPLEILITAIHDLHLRKTFGMVDTTSNIQLADLNSKPNGLKSIRDFIERVIGV